MLSIKIQTAALYVRVSTEEQAKEGYSIPAQIEILTQYCKLYNINIYNIYKDLGISGKSTVNRPGLQEMLQDASKSLFDCVVVWKISRLSRNLKDLLILVDKFESNNVSFMSYSEKFDTSAPVGRMTLQILGSIAEFERNTIVENVKMGLHQRFRSGKTIGRIAYGYKSVDKKLVVDLEEAKVIKRMFELVLSSPSAGYKKIATILNDEGFRTRKGNLWASDTVEDILKNPIYIGKLRHDISHNIKGENYTEIEGSHEAIIDEETFNKVQEKISNTLACIKNIKGSNNYFLVGLLRCPKCGGSMVSRISHRYRYYNCLTNHRFGKTKCSGGAVSADNIERSVLEKLKDFTRTKKDILDVIKAIRNKKSENAAPIIDKINIIETEISKLVDNRERYFTLFDNKNIDSRIFIEKIEKLSSQIEILQKRKQEFIKEERKSTFKVSDEQIVEHLINFLPTFEKSDMETKKRLIRALIKEITLTETKKLNKITFRFPMEDLILC